MLTDEIINQLIFCPKKITEAIPLKGMITDKKSSIVQRKNLKLISEDEQHKFDIFIRHNTMLIEQFSMGLRYQTNDKAIGHLQLIRFNGEHGQSDWSRDNHYSAFHIHRITEELLDKGIYEPKHIEITDKYATFDIALNKFLKYVNTINMTEYFPHFEKQMRLFEV